MAGKGGGFDPFKWFLRKTRGDHALAADLTQEVARKLAAWKPRLGELVKDHDQVRKTTCVQVFVDRWRRESRSPALLSLDDDDNDIDVPAKERPPDEIFEEKQISVQVQQVLAEIPLTQKDKQILVCELDGLGNAEIARKFGLSDEACRQTRQRMRNKLKKSKQLNDLWINNFVQKSRVHARLRRAVRDHHRRP